MTEAYRCEQLAQGCYVALPPWELNPWPIVCESSVLSLHHCASCIKCACYLCTCVRQCKIVCCNDDVEMTAVSGLDFFMTVCVNMLMMHWNSSFSISYSCYCSIHHPHFNVRFITTFLLCQLVADFAVEFLRAMLLGFCCLKVICKGISQNLWKVVSSC